MADAPFPSSLVPWRVRRHTHLVKLPYTLRDKLTIELETIGKREIEEPYYRGETDVRPHDPSSSSNDDSEEEDEAFSSSPPTSSPSVASSSSQSWPSSSLPPSSSPPSTPPRKSSAQPSSPPWSPPPWSPHVGGDHRFLPYPPRQVWRRYGFFVQPPQIKPIELRSRPRPRIPLQDITPEPTAVTRGHLRALGFQTYDWNFETTPWVDRDNLVGAVLIGFPTNEKAWDNAILDATAALDKAKHQMDRTRLIDDALRDGVVYGHGGGRAVRPQNIRHSLENCVELAILRTNPGVQAVITLQNEMYRTFFPKMWDRGVRTVELLRDSDSTLHLPFDEPRKPRSTAWTEVEYQFAASETPARRDDRDSLYGVRALTVLGNYNPRWTNGGDIIFWGSKIHASFPVGSTFLFPAWWMPYSFTLVDRDETHYVIMQSMDAGIDRWIENGMRSDRDFEMSALASQKKQKEEGREHRLDDILGLFSSLAEFEDEE